MRGGLFIVYHPHGVYPAMPTPFTKNGDLDEHALKELVIYYESTGLNGLLVMGTAGEFAMMSDQERRRAAEIVVGSADRLEIIINVGWASTRESVKMARFAKDIGADCAIAVEPYFYHPTTEGIARHYLDIADQADFPVMAYNIPSFAGNRIPVDVLDYFEKDERVVGIKDSEGDAAKLQAFIERASGDFAVMVGMDSLVSFGICQGAKGMMIGSASMAPRSAWRYMRRSWIGIMAMHLICRNSSTILSRPCRSAHSPPGSSMC